MRELVARERGLLEQHYTTYDGRSGIDRRRDFRYRRQAVESWQRTNRRDRPTAEHGSDPIADLSLRTKTKCVALELSSVAVDGEHTYTSLSSRPFALSKRGSFAVLQADAPLDMDHL